MAMNRKASYIPAMADAAVEAKTGKDWSGWFGLLDRAGAAKLRHKEIAAFLSEKHALPGWWSQTVTVEYERARGLRDVHQTTEGYAVGVTKTIAASLPSLYMATASPELRRKWFPRGAFEPSSQTRDKYVRGAWKKGARLEVGFYAKGKGKAQIALQVRKLSSRTDVEAQRTAWKGALSKLQTLLEK
jgi:hypothetical protein